LSIIYNKDILNSHRSVFGDKDQPYASPDLRRETLIKCDENRVFLSLRNRWGNGTNQQGGSTQPTIKWSMRCRDVVLVFLSTLELIVEEAGSLSVGNIGRGLFYWYYDKVYGLF